MNRIKRAAGALLALLLVTLFVLLGIASFGGRGLSQTTSLAQASVAPSPGPVVTSTLPVTAVPSTTPVTIPSPAPTLVVTFTPTIKPSPASTVAVTITPTFVLTPTPTLSATNAPIVFDARRIKIGQPRQVTTDDKYNADQSNPSEEVLNYPVVGPWSPDSQRILFRKMRTFNSNGQWVGTSDLYSAPLNGAPYLLVNNASEGAWSLDGSRIVYGLLRNNKDLSAGGDTYIADTNGQNPRRIAPSVALNHRATFLPDGTLARNEGSRITIMNQQGAPVRDVPNVSVVSDGVGGFLFAPDGKQVAFITSSREPALKSANAQSGEVITLSGWVDNLEAKVSWSPDSKFLAYVTSSPNELYVISANGQNSRKLMTVNTLPSLGIARPSWSPDGKVIFIGLRKGNTPDDTNTMAINVDGSGSAQILKSFMPFASSPDGHMLLLVKIGGGNLWLAEVIPQ